MKAEIIKKEDALKRFSDVTKRMIGPDLSSFFSRQIYPEYQKAQKSRWMTENESETGKWRALNPKYVAYKKRRYSSYPGSGTKKLIATGKLVAAATGESGLNKIITPKSMTVAIDLSQTPYAKQVANEFDIMRFGDKTKEVFKNMIRDYIKKRGRP